MALDANLRNVPLTGNFATRPSGEIYLTGLVANPDLQLSSTYTVSDVTPEGGSESEAAGEVYFIAMYDVSGKLVKSSQVQYSNTTQTLHAPSITSYASDSLHVSGDLTVLGDTDLSGALTARDTVVVSGNTTILGDLTVSGDSTLSSIMVDVSALSSLWVSGNNHIKGNLNVTGNTFLSGNADVSGDLFVKDDLSVLDAANVCSVFTAHNVVSALSGLGVSGETTLSSLGVSANTTMTGELTVNDILTANNIVSAFSGINVSGDLSVQSTSRDLGLLSSTTASAALGVAGTSTSAIITASSTNTAITNTAAGDIHFITNNVYVMTVENGGNVGIGTTNPAQLLDVVQTADSQGAIRIDNQNATSTSNDARYIAKVAGAGGGDPYMRFMIQGGQSWCLGLANAASDNFRITDAANLDSNVAMEIDASQDIWMPQTLAVGQSAQAADYVILECDSTTKAFLPPRMTTTQRDAIGGGIANPATGSVIYNTSTNVLNFWNGSAWGAV